MAAEAEVAEEAVAAALGHQADAPRLVVHVADGPLFGHLVLAPVRVGAHMGLDVSIHIIMAM